jgi:hypothetical protein
MQRNSKFPACVFDSPQQFKLINCLLTTTRTPERYSLSSNLASFLRFLLSVALILCVVHASAQEVGHHGQILSGALPRTSIVAAPPSASSASIRSRSAVTLKSPTNPKPSVVWHLVHGHWRWHCLAHCSKYRRPHEPSEEAPEVYYSSAKHQIPQASVSPAESPPPTGNEAKSTRANPKPAQLNSQATALNTIPIGTTISLQNWREYQQYMPQGMIELFKRTHFWKMPAEIEISVGPTTVVPLPAGYLAATEKYSHNARVVHLPNGHNDLVNYVGGEPFPNPQEPDKGYKLLADLWFAYAPHLVVGSPRNPLKSCTQDRFGNINCRELNYVYRQTAYNTDPTVQPTGRNAKDYWFTEWVMVQKPEQSKYTAQLTLFPLDNQRPEDLYTFVPSLRTTLRGSLSARCSPVAETDLIQDDYRNVGFNGGIGVFDAQFLEHRKILALTGDYTALGGDFPNNYYMPLGWPKPSWGQWQLRDVDVIDVRRVPAERAGYCYGKRVVYEDSHNHYALWEDIYDAQMLLWKTGLVAQRLLKSTSLGYVPGGVTSSAWDLLKDHMTNVSTEDEYGRDMLTNEDVPPEYQDFNIYATPGGLMGIMK